MKQLDDAPRLNRSDYWIALLIGLGALAAYVRTLAPDILYGDSAEFQTLAYTLGMTHCTGYPIYLLLGRLLGFLPIGSPAWRINLLSALGAAVTLGNVYLLSRHLTRSRVGAALGSVALGLGYTFWSQAVIAEVYTPALAFLSAIVLLLWRWHSAPLQKQWALLCAALLVGLSQGVHASAALVAPAAAIFVLWVLVARRTALGQWLRSLGVGLLGLVLGVGIFLTAFVLIDAHSTPTSFYQVALSPSRTIWGLQTTDLDSPFERLALTMSGRQWQKVMFSKDSKPLGDRLKDYGSRLTGSEFSPAILLCALLGLVVALATAPALGGLLALAIASILFLVLNYEPPDKYIFYLPTYVFLAVAAGAGAGFVLDQVHRRLAPGRGYQALYLLPAAILIVLMAWSFATSRWQALRTGAVTFAHEDYVYPLKNLSEPRQVATLRLAGLPRNAVLILDWRALYTTYYLAHVELGRTDITIMEATPYGSEGRVAGSLIEELTTALQAGRPVYAEQAFEGLQEHFRVQPAPVGKLYRLSLKG